MRTILQLVEAVTLKVVIRRVYERILNFVCAICKHWYQINGEMMHTIEIQILKFHSNVMSHEENEVSLKQFIKKIEVKTLVPHNH